MRVLIGKKLGSIGGNWRALGLGLIFLLFPSHEGFGMEETGGGEVKSEAEGWPLPKFPRMFWGAQIKWFKALRDAASPDRMAEDFERLHATGIGLGGYSRYMGKDSFDKMGWPLDPYFEALGRKGMGIFIGYDIEGLPMKAGLNTPEFAGMKEEIKASGCVCMPWTVDDRERFLGAPPTNPDRPCINDLMAIDYDIRKNVIATLQRYGRYPSLAGVVLDEPGWYGGYCGRCERLFREWLSRRFSPEQLAPRGIADPGAVKCPLPMKDAHTPARHAQPFLWGAFRHFANENFTRKLKRNVDLFHSIEPRILVAINETPHRGLRFPVSFQASGISPHLDVKMTDGYRKADIVQSFWAEKDASLNENHWFIMDIAPQRTTPEIIRRDIYYTCMYSRGVVLFDYAYMFRVTGEYDAQKKKYQDKGWYTDADGHVTMWPPKMEVVEKCLGDLEKQEEYLCEASTVSDVAIVISEDGIMNGFTGRYSTREDELWRYFVMTHIPARVIYADLMDQYDRHKVLCWTSECMSDEQVEKVKRWVKDGGVFIALNKDVSLYDAYGVQRDRCGLEEVLGVDRKGRTRGEGRRVELGDIVSQGGVPEEGKPLAALLGGKELAVINRHGRGLSIMFNENRFTQAKLMEKAEKEGIGTWHQMIGKVHDRPVWQASWKRVVEYALRFSGTPHQVIVDDCPSTVQVNLRGQVFGSDVRRILHLLSRDEKPRIEGVKAEVLVPTGCQVQRVFDPISGTGIPYRLRRGYVRFQVPAFEVYRSVVVRMRGRSSVTRPHTRIP